MVETNINDIVSAGEFWISLLGLAFSLLSGSSNRRWEMSGFSHLSTVLMCPSSRSGSLPEAKQTSLSRKASSQSSTGGGGLSSFGPAPPGHNTTSSLSIPGSPGWGRPSSPGIGGIGGGSSGGWGGLVEGWGRELGSRLGR